MLLLLGIASDVAAHLLPPSQQAITSFLPECYPGPLVRRELRELADRLYEPIRYGKPGDQAGWGYVFGGVARASSPVPHRGHGPFVGVMGGGQGLWRYRYRGRMDRLLGPTCVLK